MYQLQVKLKEKTILDFQLRSPQSKNITLGILTLTNLDTKVTMFLFQKNLKITQLTVVTKRKKERERKRTTLFSLLLSECLKDRFTKIKVIRVFYYVYKLQENSFFLFKFKNVFA